LGEGLLGLGADDRVELVAVLLVAGHQAGALERLALAVLGRAGLARAEAVQADAPGERVAAERADLHLFEVERGILLELLVDTVLELQRRELEDVVRRDLLGCDLELLLRE